MGYDTRHTERSDGLSDSRRVEVPPVIQLGGLWSETPTITAADIAEARREMWGNLGDPSAAPHFSSKLSRKN
jgi:hypothetical protein